MHDVQPPLPVNGEIPPNADEESAIKDDEILEGPTVLAHVNLGHTPHKFTSIDHFRKQLTKNLQNKSMQKIFLPSLKNSKSQVVLVACSKNTSVLCPHGAMAPQDMTAFLSIQPQILKACMDWISRRCTAFFHSPSVAYYTHVLLFIGSNELVMIQMKVQACGRWSPKLMTMALATPL
jgi:hypothetical protein